MNDPLNDLKDIHLPDPVSWWPLAPGWWILLALCLVSIAALTFLISYRKKYHAWRKAALKELAQIETSGLPEQEQIEAIAALLRRAAMTAEIVYNKPATAAKLEGRLWQEYLQKAMPEESARCIAIDRYKPDSVIITSTLVISSRQFIKGFKP